MVADRAEILIVARRRVVGGPFLPVDEHQTDLARIVRVRNLVVETLSVDRALLERAVNRGINSIR